MEPIHVSEITQFLKCRLAWFWKAPKPRGLNLEPIEQKAALRLGRLYHSALQRHYDYRVPSWKAFTKLALELAEEALDDSAWQVERDKFQEGLEDGAAILRGYDAWTNRADRHVQFIGLEIPWKFKLERGLVLAGRLDAFVLTQLGPWVLDFKTTSYYSADWTAHDLQATVYTEAARRILAAETKGVIFRFIRKKAPLGTSDLLLASGGVTKAMDITKKTTLEAYELALAVAVLAEQLGAESPDIQKYEEMLLSTEREQAPWYQEFQDRYRLARRMYYEQLRSLSDSNSFYWDQPEPRTKTQIENYFKFVVVPAAKEMRSTKKGRWVGPTGVGAAFHVCKDCRFSLPCRQVMAGEDYKATLKKDYRQRKPEDYEEV